MTEPSEEHRCPACFAETEGLPCPACGWREGAKNDIFYLPMGSLLDGRYRIGRVLGQGGFGVTYQGWEQNLRIPLAIKEYLPQQLAARAAGEATVSVAQNEQARRDYAYGLDRFLEEAQLLARFQQHPGIVSVLNFFRAHNTGYMVMEYVDGITLKEHLERQGGRIPWQEALQILTPVMDALRAVHKATTTDGEPLLHRDIAPDNIFITRQGQIKLLDFGAARFASGEHSQSISLIFKPGYAPFEQYSRRGKQGPWTDVHALSATLYHAVTGQVPPEAHDRMEEDDLQPPSALGVELPPAVERALIAGLALRAKERIQTMEALQQALRGASGGVTPPDPDPPPDPPPDPVPPTPDPKRGLIWGALLLVALLGIGYGGWAYYQQQREQAHVEALAPQAQQAAAEQAARERDDAAWQSAQGADDEAAYQAYLDGCTDHPCSRRDRAEARLAAIKTERERQRAEQERREQEERLKQQPIGHGGRYLDNGDGTVTDTVTDLQWMRCSLGQTWTGSGCSGEQKKMEWKDAKDQTARYAGYSDWRTPSIEELRTLVYCSNGQPDYFSHAEDGSDGLGCGGGPDADHLKPTLDPEAFPGQNLSTYWFWSSSADAYASDSAWFVNFTNGNGSGNDRNAYYAVRLVRGGQ